MQRLIALFSIALALVAFSSAVADASTAPGIARVAAITFSKRAVPLTVSVETTAAAVTARICINHTCQNGRYLGPAASGKVFDTFFRVHGLKPGDRISYSVSVASKTGHTSKAGTLRIVLVP